MKTKDAFGLRENKPKQTQFPKGSKRTYFCALLSILFNFCSFLSNFPRQLAQMVRKLAHLREKLTHL
jgi:hypothetical protein